MRFAPAYTIEGSRHREQEDVDVIAATEVKEVEEEEERARQVKVRLRLRGVAVETEEPLMIKLPASKPKKIARAVRGAASALPLKEVYLLDYCTLWDRRWERVDDDDDDDAAVTSATAAVLQERFFNDWIDANE